MRPERARFAHSIGHRPMYKALVYSPCKGKISNNALKINAFALSGRTNSLTSPRAMPWAMSFWALAFPSAADLFDVQPACPVVANHHLALKNYPLPERKTSMKYLCPLPVTFVVSTSCSP